VSCGIVQHSYNYILLYILYIIWHYSHI
jgi:hypothetical protein